jgi:hypothetical protein
MLQSSDIADPALQICVYLRPISVLLHRRRSQPNKPGGRNLARTPPNT